MCTSSYERLENVIQWASLSTHAFAMKIGMKRSENLYRIMRNKENVSIKLTSLILNTYPEISRDWLMYGEGEMVAPKEDKIELNMITLYGKYYDKPLTKFGMTIFNEADFAVVMLDDSMKSIIPLGA